MPVYQYECDVCAVRFELHRHFGDAHPTTCPNGHEGVHRIFAPPTVIFKGSGFYVTDNGRNGRTGGRSSKSEESSKTDAAEKRPDKAEAKAEAKQGAAT